MTVLNMLSGTDLPERAREGRTVRGFGDWKAEHTNGTGSNQSDESGITSKKKNMEFGSHRQNEPALLMEFPLCHHSVAWNYVSPKHYLKVELFFTLFYSFNGIFLLAAWMC